MGDPEPQVRVGYAALLGLPNVGKSTLLNRLLGARLAAVSPKPQTTRNRILGVKNVTVDGEACQTIWLDTPGAQHGEGGLRRFMRDEALAAAGDCDVAVLVIDAADPGQLKPDGQRGTGEPALAEALASARAPVILAVNKIDRVAHVKLLPLIEAWAAAGYHAIVPISALTGDGVDRLEAEVGKLLPRGPRLFPEDMLTDRAERFIAGELVREQLFRQLGDEVPYGTAVEIEVFEERAAKGDVVIAAVVHVDKDSHKGIVIGKGGTRLRQLGEAARFAISELLGCPVHLKLFVKVSPGWASRAQTMADFGYDRSRS